MLVVSVQGFLIFEIVDRGRQNITTPVTAINRRYALIG